MKHSPPREPPGAAWVAAWYRFQTIDAVGALREAVEQACLERSLKGTVLLAPEGVNANLTGSRQGLEEIIAGFFAGVVVNWSRAADKPVFDRLKVRAQDEILGFGRALTAAMPVAERVSAGAWNALIDDPEVRVLDVRNDYESAIGGFPGAEPAALASFREFPDFVRRELDPNRDRRIAMFCTGGIRCEKASAYLLERGFERVYQLAGGVLKYLDEVGPGANAFAGECFVFDQRVSVTAQLAPGSCRLCDGCGRPLAPADQRSRCHPLGGGCPVCGAEPGAESGGCYAAPLSTPRGGARQLRLGPVVAVAGRVQGACSRGFKIGQALSSRRGWAAAVGWMPSRCMSPASVATPSSKNGTRAAPVAAATSV